MSSPASPPARRLGTPRWLDRRLLAGLLLVAVSVVGGAQVVRAAQQTTPSWSAVRDLPSGTVVQADDLRLVDVRLGEGAGRAYLAAGESPVGRVLSRPLAQGELVPASVTRASPDGEPLRRVAVPVDALHTAAEATALLDRRVDLFATAEEAGVPVTRAVLRGATVVDVRLGGAGGDIAVVVLVPPGTVPGLVAALRAATLDVVVVQGDGEDVSDEAVRYQPAGAGGPVVGPAPDGGTGTGPGAAPVETGADDADAPAPPPEQGAAPGDDPATDAAGAPAPPVEAGR